MIDSNEPHVFNLGVGLDDLPTDTWDVAKVIDMPTPGERTYLLSNGDALARVLLAETQDNSAASARFDLEVNDWMRPARNDEDRERPAIGERARNCDDGSGTPAAISFTRGNIFVAVHRASDEPFDAAEVAAAIDLALADDPGDEVDEHVVEGEARQIIARHITIGRSQRIHAETTDGELVLEGETILFVTSGDGPHRVRISTRASG